MIQLHNFNRQLYQKWIKARKASTTNDVKTLKSNSFKKQNNHITLYLPLFIVSRITWMVRLNVYINYPNWINEFWQPFVLILFKSNGVLQVLSKSKRIVSLHHIFSPPIGNLKENSPTGKFTTRNKKANTTGCITY